MGIASNLRAADGPRPLVEIRGLTKAYVRGKQVVEVLHGIDLDIPEGDFVALMGPSGSGKTTLLNLIGGLDSPSGLVPIPSTWGWLTRGGLSLATATTIS